MVDGRNPLKSVGVTLGFLAFAYVAAQAVASTATPTALFLAAGLCVFIVSFLSPEIGLYVIIASMLLSPEISLGAAGTGSMMETKRSIVVRLEDMMLLVVGFCWLARSAVYKELGLLRTNPLNRPILLYVLAGLLSTTLGFFRDLVQLRTGFFYLLKYVEYFVVFFVVINFIHSEKQVKRFLIVAFLTCAIASVIGIAQIPTGVRVSAPFEGTQGEPNTFGGYLVFMMSLAAGIFLKTNNVKYKIACLALLGLAFFPFLYTLSRSSWMAALPAVGILLVLSERRALVAACLVMAAMVMVLATPRSVKKRVEYTFGQAAPHPIQVEVGGRRLDPSASARLHSWDEAVREWASDPFKVLVGYGVTGYGFIDAQYVRTLVEMGVIGLMAFLALLYALLRNGLRIYQGLKEDDLFKGLTLGYLAGTVALAVHSLGANSFIIVRIMEPFWFVTGIMAMIPEIKPELWNPDAGKHSNR